MQSAEYDLVYWWHKRFEEYPELENRARISLIRRSRESATFCKDRLREYFDVDLNRSRESKSEPWLYRASRIGIDRGSKQAIGAFYLSPGNSWHNIAFTLLMTWDEADGVISELASKQTVWGGK
jgi:hypothetical protein